jgi:hypothetical protein
MEVRENVRLESNVVREVHGDSPVLPAAKPEETAPSTELRLAPSTLADAFAMPSESPMQELSPGPNAQVTKESTSAEALSTAISTLFRDWKEGAGEEPELPTFTPNSAGFSYPEADIFSFPSKVHTSTTLMYCLIVCPHSSSSSYIANWFLR